MHSVYGLATVSLNFKSVFLRGYIMDLKTTSASVT